MCDDSWVYDGFTIIDHDYSYEPYRDLIQKKGLSILGPYIQESHQEWTNSDIRILVLGGSTTSILLGSTWSSHLMRLLTENYQMLSKIGDNKKKSISILNGGCGFYNSFNEYMKLNRDISSTRPTLIISLSGVNDAIVPKEISSGVVNDMIGPLVQSSIFKVNHNGIFNIERVERWIEEATHMKALSDLYGVKFLRFLQPTLGTMANPVKSMSPHLLGIVQKTVDFLGAKYINQVGSFYQLCISNINAYPFVIDISNSVPSEDNLWSDGRHPSDLGYLKIAEAMLVPVLKILKS